MTVAENLAAAMADASVPGSVRAVCERLLVDVAGLCVAARGEDYVAAVKRAVDPGGACTAIGHAGGFGPGEAALLNGTAAHGEDFDDTFEGGPVHAGAVVVPAVLAAAERHGLSGAVALRAIALGVEITCRLSTLVPKAVHKAGFHPTAVFGAIGAAAGCAAALGADRAQTASALGIAGSLASGIIEYLAEGTWTKRMHPGWAAQSGYRAARLAIGGFAGPRTVFEGEHGLFHAFAHARPKDWDGLLAGFGGEWVTETIAFKPYACGTMIHPYIDCARRLATRGIAAERIAAIECETAEGILHRLWEPLAAKRNPPNGYAAKFSIPFGIAAGFILGEGGLGAFTDARARDPALRALAGKVGYVVDPANPYPKVFTGHIKVTLVDGTVVEERQPHFRGGQAEPLTRAEIDDKFRLNARHGGWDAARADGFLAFAGGLFDAARIDLSAYRG